MKAVAIFSAAALFCCLAKASADEVILHSGDRLTGQIFERNEQSLVLQHPALGQLTIPADQVKSASVDVEPAPAEESLVESPPPAEPDSSTLTPRFFQNWDSQLEMGLAGASGNSKYTNFRVGLLAQREDDFSKWKFDTASPDISAPATTS